MTSRLIFKSLFICILLQWCPANNFDVIVNDFSISACSSFKDVVIYYIWIGIKFTSHMDHFYCAFEPVKLAPHKWCCVTSLFTPNRCPVSSKSPQTGAIPLCSVCAVKKTHCNYFPSAYITNIIRELWRHSTPHFV